jgi:hypothetical protein
MPQHETVRIGGHATILRYTRLRSQATHG